MILFGEIIRELLTNHRGKVLGALLGLGIGLIIIEFGIFVGLFLMICIMLGYFIGKRYDEGDLGDLLDKLFRNR
jgi:uncharacterized membrane protein